MVKNRKVSLDFDLLSRIEEEHFKKDNFNEELHKEQFRMIIIQFCD